MTRSLLRPAPALAGEDTIAELFEIVEAEAAARPAITVGHGRDEPAEIVDAPRDTTDEQVDDALHDEAFGDGQ